MPHDFLHNHRKEEINREKGGIPFFRGMFYNQNFSVFIVNCQRIFSLSFLKNYFIIVQLQLSAFSPHNSLQPQPNPPPSLASTFPFGFVHVSFIVVTENPSPHCLLPTSFVLLLDCS